MRKPLKGILLDFDNTILDSKGAYEHSLQRLGEFWYERFRKNNFRETFEIYKKKNRERLGSLPYHRNRILVLKAMLRETHEYPDFHLLLEMDRIYFESFVEYIELWKEKNPVGSLLSYIKKFSQFIKLILITNESIRTQLIKARAMFPVGFPIQMVTSEEVGIEKPDPDFFRFVLGEYSLLPEDVIVVGDSLQDDIRGAMNSGILPFRVNSVFGGSGYREEILDGMPYLNFESTLGVFQYLERELPGG